MNTKEFVAMQLGKPFRERRIPDALYIRTRNFRAILSELTAGRKPENAGFCFDNGFMYENYERYIGAFSTLYPNVIITEEECQRAHNRLYSYADGQATRRSGYTRYGLYAE